MAQTRPTPSELHAAAAASLRRPPPQVLPPVLTAFSQTLSIPLPPITTPHSLPSEVRSTLHHLPSVSLSFSVSISATTALSASLICSSPARFCADGVVSLSLIPTTSRPAPRPRTFSFHLSCDSPSTPPVFLTTPPPPTLRALHPKQAHAPPIWRGFRDPSHGVVTAEGHIILRVDVVLHTMQFADMAAEVERAVSLRAGEVEWRRLLEAVARENRLAGRVVTRNEGPGRKYEISLVELAAKAGKADYVRFLLAKGANVTGRRCSEGCLHAAVANGDVGLVELMVGAYNADVEADDANGETPLFRVAALDGDVKRKMVLFLVAGCGAKVDSVSNEGVCGREIVGEDSLAQFLGAVYS